MEIAILIAIIMVAASALYVALKFNTRTERSLTDHIDPLIEAKVNNIRKEISDNAGREQKETARLRSLIREVSDDQRGSTSDELRQQTQVIISQLREATSSELRQQIQKITDELQQEKALVKRLSDELNARQNQLGENLAQVNYRVAELGKSLSWQGSQLADIHRHTKGQVDQAEISPELVPLASAMLEAESYADHTGWGTPPQLYALTTAISLGNADHRPLAAIRQGRPDRFILTAHEPLPQGDLIEALANIRWAGDVAGCVLVTELTNLPARGEGDAPVDPDAADQWASPHPDGRPGRLAVGVRKSGEHLCILRLQGELDVQIRNELGGEIVAALQETF